MTLESPWQFPIKEGFIGRALQLDTSDEVGTFVQVLVPSSLPAQTTGGHSVVALLYEPKRDWLGHSMSARRDLKPSSGSRAFPGWRGTPNSHKNRLDGVLDIAEGCPAQQLSQTPLSQLCWVLLFLLWCLEGRGRPAVDTDPCG